PRPLFLLNIGHAYRRARELAKAKNAYENLLKMQPDIPQRAEVEGYIKAIDDALSAGEAPKPEEPPKRAGVVEPSPAPVAPPPALNLVDPSSTSSSAFGPPPSVAPDRKSVV